MESKSDQNTIFRDWFFSTWPEIGRGGFNCNASDISGDLDLAGPLLGDAASLADGSVGLAFPGYPRERGFCFGQKHGTLTPTKKASEASAEGALFQHYWDWEKGKSKKTLGGNTDIREIHSYQVPLHPHEYGKKENEKSLGDIDLLGADTAGRPVVFELKYSGEGSGTGVNRLFGPIVQGFAYALTLRHYWDKGMRSEWESEFDTVVPHSLQDSETPIVITANETFWEAGRTWSHLPWSSFLIIAKNLGNAGLPLYAAKFKDIQHPELTVVKFEDLHGSDEGTAPIVWP